jgi:hypothetical protein
MDSLTHYTRSLQGIVGILNNGLAWIPNRRNLMSKLVCGPDFSKREPQQFGMISFIDWPPPATERHRGAFGDFGIVVSREWAQAPKPLRGFELDNVKPELRAQRVMYLEDGPFFDALRRVYQAAFDHQSINWEDSSLAGFFATSPVINKAMAGVEGYEVLANLLTLYEYLEDGEHAFQSEWRIVHPLPMFGYPGTTAEIVEAVSLSQGWAEVTDSRSLTLPVEAIIGFVCPVKEEAALRRAVPPQFSERPIVVV